MKKKWKEVVTLKFTGERFDDLSLDLLVLQELINYQNLIIKTAKELWFQRNPGRIRLPKNFEEALVLKFNCIEEGSSEIPLLAIIPDEQEITESNTLVEEPIKIITETAERINAKKPLPEELPKNIIPDIVALGKTMHKNECLYFSNSKGKFIRFSENERDRLSEYIEKRYEDFVTIKGSVKKADFSKNNYEFDLFTDDKLRITVLFDDDKDEIVTEALKKRETIELEVTGKAEFNPDGSIDRIIKVDDMKFIEDDEIQFDPNEKPIWETMLELSKEIPEDELKNFPKDASDNLDKYLYGN